jgi:hypothetical protein
MKLSKEDHRAILLELIDKAMFTGAVVDAVVELRDDIRKATIEGAETNATPPAPARKKKGPPS